MLGRLDHPRGIRVPEVQRNLEQLRRVGRGAARTRRGGACLERRDDLGLGDDTGETEVPRALLGVVDNAREVPVRDSALGRRRSRVDARGQQRMCESHAAELNLHDARRFGVTEQLGRVLVFESALYPGDTRPRRGRRQQQRLEHVALEAGKAHVDQLCRLLGKLLNPSSPLSVSARASSSATKGLPAAVSSIRSMTARLTSGRSAP